MPDSPRNSDRMATALVALSLVQVVLVLAQGFTAGHVLTGNRTFVAAHEVVGANVVGFVSIGQAIVAGLLVRRRAVASWVLVLAIVAFGLVVAQVFLGFDGRMALHVPNALLVLAAQFVLVDAGRRVRPSGAMERRSTTATQVD